jgi:hypothetical protein
MRLRTLAAAAALVVGAGSTLAADQSIDLSSGIASFTSTSPVLQGGDDVITFTNLAYGTYDFLLTFSGQWLTLSSASVNDVAGLFIGNGKVVFGGVEGVGNSPFTLTLVGNTNKSIAQYSGEISVTAVPEPETYAMFIAGLGVLGFMARRRRQQA